MSFFADNCRVDSLEECLQLPIDVLRLDLLHPVVSGNKWFKLKEYLRLAKAQLSPGLLTYGGAFSNHIVATAAAARAEGLESIGLIRGERPALLSKTLTDAAGFGMQLHFLSRTDYAAKKMPPDVLERVTEKKFLVVPEGGYGELGRQGAAGILALIEPHRYSHIITAVGTGTTSAGLVAASHRGQKIIGIPVLKNSSSIQAEINALLPADTKDRFILIDNYHFGGYAKKNHALISFMNEFYRATAIPSDFVYTGKTFYAVIDLFRQGYFQKNPRILIIHTGGLQGNSSLSKGTLIFE